MKLPKKKKIKGKVYRVMQIEQPVSDDGEICDGTLQYDERVIEIKSRLPKDAKLRTYLHEALHAIVHENGIKLTVEQDERLVQDLEDNIMHLFKIVPR